MTYKPIPTTKKEMISAIDEACKLATMPITDVLMTTLNQQLGALKYLAKHLPKDTPPYDD